MANAPPFQMHFFQPTNQRQRRVQREEFLSAFQKASALHEMHVAAAAKVVVSQLRRTNAGQSLLLYARPLWSATVPVLRSARQSRHALERRPDKPAKKQTTSRCAFPRRLRAFGSAQRIPRRIPRTLFAEIRHTQRKTRFFQADRAARIALCTFQERLKSSSTCLQWAVRGGLYTQQTGQRRLTSRDSKTATGVESEPKTCTPSRAPPHSYAKRL